MGMYIMWKNGACNRKMRRLTVSQVKSDESVPAEVKRQLDTLRTVDDKPNDVEIPNEPIEEEETEEPEGILHKVSV
jgi:hypothetical protein